MKKLAVRVSSVLLALASLSGTAAAVAGSADAATAPQVKACFVWSSTNASVGVQQLFLQYWTGSSWVTHKTGATNSAGCGTFSGAYASTYYQIRLYQTYGSTTVGISAATATTGWAATGTTGLLNLGSYKTDFVRIY